MNQFARFIARKIDDLMFSFWQRVHPCRIAWNEYDHDYVYVDNSFDHEFGTEQSGHWECQNCGEVNGEMEPPEYDPWENDPREIRLPGWMDR